MLKICYNLILKLLKIQNENKKKKSHLEIKSEPMYKQQPKFFFNKAPKLLYKLHFVK